MVDLFQLVAAMLMVRLETPVIPILVSVFVNDSSLEKHVTNVGQVKELHFVYETYDLF